MEITALTLPAADLGEVRSYYSEVLGLPLLEDRGALEVPIGGTRVRFEPGTGAAAHDHLAFDIPAPRFADAKAWLRSRVELLALDGEDEFEGPDGWNSRSLYFPGPAGSILELIARRDLPAVERPGPFTARDLLRVSEVGIAVPDVLDAVAAASGAGLPVFGAGPDPEFTPVGDQAGLLVLVRPGRRWYPTDDRPATTGRLSVTLRGAVPTSLQLGGASVRIEGEAPPFRPAEEGYERQGG